MIDPDNIKYPTLKSLGYIIYWLCVGQWQRAWVNFLWWLRDGYHESELWSLTDTITNFVLPRLRDFRENPGGFPLRLAGHEEWEAKIDAMIRAFELIQEEDTFLSDEEAQQEISAGLPQFSRADH